MSASTTEPLIFYDVLSKRWPQTWSPYTMRILLTLKHLEIPYTHIPVSYPDIKPLLSSLNVPESTIKGAPAYTLPAITIPATATTSSHTIMGSMEIARYLCTLKPSHATVIFPNADESTAAATEFDQKVFGKVMMEGYMQHVLPFTPLILDPAGAEYIEETKKLFLGSLKESRERVLVEEQEMGGLKEVMEKALMPIVEFYESSGELQLQGGEILLFYGGRRMPQFVDFCAVALVMWGVMVRGEVVLEALDGVAEGRVAEVVRRCLTSLESR
ncbi:hypothetical protein D6D01_06659 [Aureobasidium pullulans]|uniref:Uncharacterized protein n=1 Tax=Aureobasidium pullulans TaxID=5580 RepID=A0A4S9KVW7_AURPU|nr:hypothetical protein D6D01_06659 [Aureobasidium pullulans]